MTDTPNPITPSDTLIRRIVDSMLRVAPGEIPAGLLAAAALNTPAAPQPYDVDDNPMTIGNIVSQWLDGTLISDHARGEMDVQAERLFAGMCKVLGLPWPVSVDSLANAVTELLARAEAARERGNDLLRREKAMEEALATQQFITAQQPLRVITGGGGSAVGSSGAGGASGASVLISQPAASSGLVRFVQQLDRGRIEVSGECPIGDLEETLRTADQAVGMRRNEGAYRHLLVKAVEEQIETLKGIGGDDADYAYAILTGLVRQARAEADERVRRGRG